MTVVVFLARRSAVALSVLFVLTASAPAHAEFNATPGLTTINAHYAYARGLDGRGQALGIMDTGVHMAHPELAGRVFGVVMQGLDKAGHPCQRGPYLTGDKACFFSDGRPSINYFETDGRSGAGPQTEIAFESHGTHVAGTMIAARDGKGVQGVAPQAKLFSATFSSNSYVPRSPLGSIIEDRILAVSYTPEALERAYAGLRRANVRAVNQSWGFENSAPESLAFIDGQFKKYAYLITPIAAATLETGLIQVWAAGNASGAMADVPAALPHYLPALEPYWLSVVSASADGKLDEFSSRCGASRQWCVAAPGDNVLSSMISGPADAKLVREQGRIVGIDVAAEQRPASTYAKEGAPRWPHRTSPPRWRY